MQNILMKFDPATGEERPYPSHAAQWRRLCGGRCRRTLEFTARPKAVRWNDVLGHFLVESR